MFQIRSISIRFIIFSIFLLHTTLYAFVQPTADLEQKYAQIRQDLVKMGYLNGEMSLALDYLKQLESNSESITYPVGTTFMEKYLADPDSGYGFKSAKVAEKSLNKLIETHQIDTKDNVYLRELVLGDAYHWLGHLYEERHDLIRAFECYVRSYYHYSQTPIQRSPRINQSVEVHEHSIFHLGKIRNIIFSYVSSMQYYKDVIVPRQREQALAVACRGYFN